MGILFLPREREVEMDGGWVDKREGKEIYGSVLVPACPAFA